MKLTIQVDNYPHQIDTIDPELLGKWIVEIFGRMGDWTPATYVTIQAYPSWLMDERGEYHSDWATDSAVLGRARRVLSPRDLLSELAKQLDEADALKENSL